MRNLPGTIARTTIALTMGALLALSATSSAGAASFAVNSTGDGSDVSTGDLVCMASDGSCTLRAAIEQANFLPGPDTITFSIAPGGVQTIAPTSPLPSISDITTIDGTSQPGFSGSPLIELDGVNAGAGVDGLTLAGSNITIRGLAINSFGGYGIQTENTASNPAIEGNFVGLAPDGVTDRGNGNAGIDMTVSGTVGGTSVAQRNVVSGNGGNGVRADLAAVTVSGNYIGTNAAGTAVVPNDSPGVYVQGAGTTIDRNLISGNHGAGVYSLGGVSNVTISNNLIGTAANGTTPLGNVGDGVRILIAQNIMVGSGNTIAYNSGAGVYVWSTDGNTVAGNSIHDNVGLGIDLRPDGVTPNDLGDGDGGANGLQNYPVLTSATSDGGSTTLIGTLNSSTNTNFTIEFDYSPSCDPSGYGEGRSVLGTIALATTDGSGNYSFNRTFSNLATGQNVTAIATNLSTGDSSEFSRCIAVNCPGSTGGWNIPPGDSDCDGFTDAREGFMATDAADWCASTSAANDEPTPDAWPVDLDDNQRVTITDVSRFSSVFGSTAPGPPYAVRYDFNADNKITITDVSQFSQFFGKNCSP